MSTALIRALVIFPALLLAALGTYGTSAQCEHPVTHEHDHLHHHHFAEFAKVPDKARSRRNPLASDPDSILAGGKLFSQHCAKCHGDTAEGGRKAPSLRAREVQNATPGTVFWILTNGVVRRGMPVWSKLPEPERWQVVTFIKSLPSSTNSDMHSEHQHEQAISQEDPSTKQ